MVEFFLKPRLTGKRFDDHSIPLAFLKDIAILEVMISELAKYEFLNKNQGRKRIPKGFFKDVYLRLERIEAGSAILSISLHSAVSFPLFEIDDDHHYYFELARDKIIATIKAALNNEIPSEFPRKILRHFDIFGSSLHEGESLELSSPNIPEPAKLTKEIRHFLAWESKVITKLTEEISLRGSIPEMDQRNNTFEFWPINGKKIRTNIPPEHHDAILNAFCKYKEGGKVLLNGVGIFSKNEDLTGFESIDSVDLLEPLDTESCLEEFKSLKDGWLDGYGVAPSKDGLDWLISAFDTHFPDQENVPLPHLYPTEEGGVSAEWIIKPWDISLDINLKTRCGYFHCLNLDTENFNESNLDLQNADDWKKLIEHIVNAREGRNE